MQHRAGCVTNYVDAYLQTGALPPVGTVCPANPTPFLPTATGTARGEHDAPARRSAVRLAAAALTNGRAYARAVAPDPDEGNDLVELGRWPAIEAELVAGRLREIGVDAVVFDSNLGALAATAVNEGSRVMVRRRDVGRAEAELAE